MDRASRAQGGTGLGQARSQKKSSNNTMALYGPKVNTVRAQPTIVLPCDKDAVKEEIWEDEIED